MSELDKLIISVNNLFHTKSFDWELFRFFGYRSLKHIAFGSCIWRTLWQLWFIQTLWHRSLLVIGGLYISTWLFTACLFCTVHHVNVRIPVLFAQTPGWIEEVWIQTRLFKCVLENIWVSSRLIVWLLVSSFWRTNDFIIYGIVGLIQWHLAWEAHLVGVWYDLLADFRGFKLFHTDNLLTT